MSCNRFSGSDGAFRIPLQSGFQVVPGLRNWNMSYNNPITSESRSNTKGYQVSWAGVKSVSGGFSCAGADGIIKIKDAGIFTGYTGGGIGTTGGRLYSVRAVITQATFNFDWQAKTCTSDYQFVSNYNAAGDELKIETPTATTPAIITDSSAPKSFRPSASNPVQIITTDATPKTSNICVQNATLTFSASPNATADSCSGGWQVLMGLGAVNVTFSATCTCNDFEEIPDIGKCNILKIYTDICDATKFWEFSYFVMAGKDNLTIDTVSANGITYTINMTYSIAPCDCGSSTTGKIIAPGNVLWTL